MDNAYKTDLKARVSRYAQSVNKFDSTNNKTFAVQPLSMSDLTRDRTINSHAGGLMGDAELQEVMSLKHEQIGYWQANGWEVEGLGVIVGIGLYLFKKNGDRNKTPSVFLCLSNYLPETPWCVATRGAERSFSSAAVAFNVLVDVSGVYLSCGSDIARRFLIDTHGSMYP